VSDLADDAPTIDAARYRQVLGHFATGVTIITAMHEGEPVGVAANSFTSVSLDPPLVAFCAAHSSSTWPAIQASGRFCVNVLGEDQEDLCRLFATKGADRFRAVGWRRAPDTGSPVLDGVLAWLDCRIEAEHEAGDHVVAIARVLDMGLATAHDGKPLVFYRGGYGRFEA
jgi:3-hydroxy-9,10-secoandrosta-1,3,5(10)-triene-9,17-dione monooxygenase reductase component